MGIISRSITFADGEEVTAAEMNSLVEAASLSGITRSNIDQDTLSILTEASSAPPGVYVGEIFQKTGYSTPYISVWDGDDFVDGTDDILRVRSTSTAISKGEALRVSNFGGEFIIAEAGISTTATNFIGIAIENIASVSFGIIQISGLCNEAKVTGTVNIGDALRFSGTFGVLESDGTVITQNSVALARTANPSGSGTVKAWIIT